MPPSTGATQVVYSSTLCKNKKWTDCKEFVAIRKTTVKTCITNNKIQVTCRNKIIKTLCRWHNIGKIF